MIAKDFHVHTNYGDGQNTPRKVVEEALAKRMEAIGISEHGYTDFDDSYCMSIEKSYEYYRCIRALQKEFSPRIEVLCGVEQDYYAGKPILPFDYVIGSVHYVKVKNAYYPVDHSPEMLKRVVAEGFDGDYYAMAEQYFDSVSKVIDATGADVIGHFNLITKYNEKENLFDESHPRYVAAWKKAADLLLATGKPFEINTGAISRLWRTVPYPSEAQYTYLKAKGAKFILSSDSHQKDTLMFQFEQYEEWLKG